MDKKTRQYINNLLNKYFKWVILLIVLLIFVAGYFWVVKPQYKETLGNIESELGLKGKKYLHKKEQLEKIRKMASVYNNMDSQKIERINIFLPTDHDYEQLFTEVSSLVSRNGMVLNGMDMNVEKEADEKEGGGIRRDNNEQEMNIVQRETPSEVKTIRMKLDIVGVNYSTLKSFLASVENNLRLMDVVNVNFHPKKGEAQLRVRTYYFDPEEFNVEKDVIL